MVAPMISRTDLRRPAAAASSSRAEAPGAKAKESKARADDFDPVAAHPKKNGALRQLSLTSAEGKKAIQKALAQVNKEHPDLSPDGTPPYEAVSVERDAKGQYSVTLQRTVDGTAVEGDQIVVQLSATGRAEGILGRVTSFAQAMNRLFFTLTRVQAREMVERANAESAKLIASDHKLIVRDGEQAYRAVYEFQCIDRSDPSSTRRFSLLVDAQTGELSRRDLPESAAHAPNAVDSDALWGAVEETAAREAAHDDPDPAGGIDGK